MVKKKFVWKGFAYRDRSSWMKAVRSDPECEKKRMLNLSIAARKPSTQAKHRRDMRLRLARMSAVKRRQMVLPMQAASRERMKVLWKDKIWRAMMVKRRKEAASRSEVRMKLSKNARKQWRGQSGKRMRAERRNRWKDPIYREKMRRVFRTKGSSWNAGLTKSTHPVLKALSERFIGRIPRRGQTLWLYRNGSVCIPMRSSYEVLFARWCDSKGISWRYEPRWFNIGGGNWKGVSYTPDFYLPLLDTYVEIKGYLSPENLRKLQAFQQKFPDVKHYLLLANGLQALRVMRQHVPRRKSLQLHVRGVHRMFV